jgi:hypothetical protein
MTERTLQNTVSMSLILAHSLTVILVFVLYLVGGLTSPELTTSLSIILPMLGALTGLAVGYVIKVKKKRTMAAASEELSGVYVFTAFFLPALFILMIVALILMKAFNRGLASFDQFKTALAGVETIFGAYTGKVLSSLFEKTHGAK